MEERLKEPNWFYLVRNPRTAYYSAQVVSDAQIPIVSLELSQHSQLPVTLGILGRNELLIFGTNGCGVMPQKKCHPGPGPDTFCLFIQHKKEYQPS